MYEQTKIRLNVLIAGVCVRVRVRVRIYVRVRGTHNKCTQVAIVFLACLSQYLRKKKFSSIKIKIPLIDG